VVTCSHRLRGGGFLAILVKKYARSQEEVFVIGGADVALQAMPYTRIIYYTKVMIDNCDGDTFFPVDLLDKSFELTYRIPDRENGIYYDSHIWEAK
jgi:dihydrofolate reductase